MHANIIILLDMIRLLTSDENECKYRPCDVFAHCTNTMGSFYCSCFPGYDGDGFTCHGKSSPFAPYYDYGSFLSQHLLSLFLPHLFFVRLLNWSSSSTFSSTLLLYCSLSLFLSLLHSLQSSFSCCCTTSNLSLLIPFLLFLPWYSSSSSIPWYSSLSSWWWSSQSLMPILLLASYSVHILDSWLFSTLAFHFWRSLPPSLIFFSSPFISLLLPSHHLLSVIVFQGMSSEMRGKKLCQTHVASGEKHEEESKLRWDWQRRGEEFNSSHLFSSQNSVQSRDKKSLWVFKLSFNVTLFLFSIFKDFPPLKSLLLYLFVSGILLPSNKRPGFKF